VRSRQLRLYLSRKLPSSSRSATRESVMLDRSFFSFFFFYGGRQEESVIGWLNDA